MDDDTLAEITTYGTAGTNTSSADAEAEGGRQKRETSEEKWVEGMKMFIPREKMTGIHPLGSLPIMDEDKSDICACEEAGTRFRKEMIMTSFDWLAGFNNPLDIDFKDQKGKWEEYITKKFLLSETLKIFGFGGVTILSMKKAADPSKISLDTEILFASEYNSTILDELDTFDSSRLGSDWESSGAVTWMTC